MGWVKVEEPWNQVFGKITLKKSINCYMSIIFKDINEKNLL